MTQGLVASESPTRILYLARHGQSAWNHSGRVTGALDPELSSQGLAQADGLARCLSGQPLDAIYASALQRTIQTAQPTADATRLPITPIAALNEIDLGELQGRYRDGRDPEASDLWTRWQADPWTFRVPGGERFDEFAARVEEALAAVLARHRHGTLLIVGHRATNRVVLGTLLRWPREQWFELRPRHKFCYRLDLADARGTPRIDTLTLVGRCAGAVCPGLVQ